MFEAKSKNIASCTINASCKFIEDSAFYNCSNLTSITIPDSVTSIGSAAFFGCTSLTSITIPNSVKSIGDSAFNSCAGLTNITIPDSVTSIGSSAFYNCTILTSVTIGNSVTSIGYEAFRLCYKLVEVVNKSSLQFTLGSTDNGYVAYYAKQIITDETDSKLSTTNDGFVLYTDNTDVYLVSYIGNNTEVVIPNTITKINDYAFYNCTSLTNITIPDSVTSIGNDAFSGCTKLMFNEYDNAFYLGSTNNPYAALIKAKRTNIISCEINTDCKCIARGAFSWCTSLTSITIPDSVTSVGSNAFGDGYFGNKCPIAVATIPAIACSYVINSELKTVIITSGTGIETYAFYGCKSLTSITIPDSVTGIGYRAFYGCYQLVEVINKSSLQLTLGSEDNGYVAYYAKQIITDETNSKLSTTNDGFVLYTDNTDVYLVSYVGNNTKVVIPNNVTSIGDYAFYNCTSLTSVTIPNSVTSIGDGAFSGCTSLTSITIPEGVTSVGSSAFSNCTSLTSITIPNSVTSIGDYAFENFYKSRSIYYGGTIDQYANLSNKPSRGTVYYYSESEPVEAGNWWHYVNDVPTVW